VAIEGMIVLNVGEKITLYKERSEFKNYADFAKAAGVSSSWLLDISKKESLALVDANSLVNLCGYLGISVQQLVVNDDEDQQVLADSATTDVDSNDIGVLLNKMIVLLSQDDCKLSGVIMNGKARQVCKDALEVSYVLVKQHL